jgi:competence protein ComEC
VFKLTKAKIFFWLGAIFLGGIFLSQFFNFNLILKLVIINCALILIFIWHKYRICLFIGLGILVFLFGMFRYEIALPKVDNTWVQYYNEKEEIKVIGNVVSEPDIRIENTRLTLGNLKLGDNENKLKGKILVTVPKYPEFNYGDSVVMQAKLKDPGEFNEFNYRDFLAKSGIYSVSYNPKIELVSSGHGNLLFNYILKIKSKFRSSLTKILSEPQASLMDGLLLGNKSGLSKELMDKFNFVGVSHIIVVSGYHVTIICSILLAFGMYFLSRKQSFVLAVTGLLFFIIITGVQSSAIRASIMGGLVLVALNSGRMSNIRNVLLFSALTIVFINPLLLSFDVGFQLSFLATIGIVYFTPIILKYLKFLPNIFKLQEILGMTLAAQLLVLPIIFNNFQRLSVISPLVNILILPFVPLTMLFGFMGGIFGLFVLPIGRLFGLLAWLLVSYMIWLVEFFVKFDFASIEVDKLWFGWTILYYVIIIVSWRFFRKKIKT